VPLFLNKKSIILMLYPLYINLMYNIYLIRYIENNRDFDSYKSNTPQQRYYFDLVCVYTKKKKPPIINITLYYLDLFILEKKTIFVIRIIDTRSVGGVKCLLAIIEASKKKKKRGNYGVILSWPCKYLSLLGSRFPK
jgi:hypothetical protein